MLAKSQPLNVWDRIGLIALLAAVLVVGCITVIRSTLVVRRTGDFGVYTSAAWAVRSGADLRQTGLDWHYVYPPTLAVLMVPLAEPPKDQPDVVALPLPVSVGLWYAINVLCLVFAVHLLAGALEQSCARRENGASRATGAKSRAWWRLRIFPALACSPAVVHTLTRGQVNLILLLLICGFLAALLRGRAFRAGAYLAGAICLKLIPAFLLLVSLWRREARCLAGCAAGLVGIGVFIPMLGLGIEGTINDYRQFGQIVLGPGLGFGGDQRAAGELTNVVGTNSQSPMRILHAWMHPNREQRPVEIPLWIRRVHWLFGGSLVLLTLLAGKDLCGWRGRTETGLRRPGVSWSMRLTLFTGLLTINMLLLSPVCHPHYLCLAIPTLMALLVRDWQGRTDDWMSFRLTGLMVLFLVAVMVPTIPGMERLKDGGMAGLALLLVWLAGLNVLWQTRPRRIEAACVFAIAAKPQAARIQVSPSTSFSTSSET